MESGKRVLIIISIISSSCLFPSEAGAETHLELVSNTCKQVGDVNSCTNVLKTLPLSTNLQSMAVSALDAAKKQTTSVRDFFNDKSSKNPQFEKALKVCAEQFEVSIHSFNPMVLEGGTGSLDVHYALDNMKVCEDGLAKSNVHIDEITSKLREWMPYFTAAYATVMAMENTAK
ncbi:hypothetical protein K2173_015653 [Erythroxylum novogranatense]|uniref:Pectinesterase inhibitor domain-containing protein n=1 Tax=Erythroxylum novogranatense TaxID=1862640 RepID=A0AAV8TG80_9ROSI|nr:hypothetical protein K2173_015653 [Erythroxylum novogranatense]